MQPSEQTSSSRPLLGVLALIGIWLVVIAVGTYLTVERFRQAVEGPAGDDLRIFVRAAAEVRAGHSPYDAATYVYSPLVAWLMTPFASLQAALRPWAGISLTLCWATVAAVVATFWRMLRPWQRPLLALIAFVTLLFSHVTETELQLGQVDVLMLFFLAATVLLSALQLPIGSGASLALVTLVKSWPLASALWIFRRGAEARWRSVVALSAGILLMIAVVLLTGGTRELGQWVTATVTSTQQPLLAYSVWGFGRFLFTDNGVMAPIVASPLLGSIVSWVLAAAVVVLIVVILRRPGSASLAMWNLVAAVVLLLPVSHLAYRILLIPLLWVWVAHALRKPRLPNVAAAAVMFVLWLLTDRTQPLDARHSDNHLLFAVIVIGTLAALTLSVLVAAKGQRAGTYAEPLLRGDVAADHAASA